MNLAQFTKDAFGTNFVMALGVTLYANCRVARIYFSNKSYGEAELPEGYRIVPAAKSKAFKFAFCQTQSFL